MQSTMSALMETSHEYDVDVEQGNELVLQEEDNDEDWDATGEDKKWPGWPGDSVFRILVPSQKVGGLIGRKGEFIKKMCEESRSRIKILDGPPGAPERTVSHLFDCFTKPNHCCKSLIMTWLPLKCVGIWEASLVLGNGLFISLTSFSVSFAPLLLFSSVS